MLKKNSLFKKKKDILEKKNLLISNIFEIGQDLKQLNLNNLWKSSFKDTKIDNL